MVRFELDSATEAGPLEGSTNDNVTEHSNDVDCLTDAMRDTSVNDRLLPLPKCTEIKSGIKIHKTNYPAPPLSSFIETKTRSARGELDYVDIYGQLAFSQTPNLFVARHHKGYFQTLEKISLGEGILKDIAEATQETMAKTAGMIKEMMDTVEEFGEVTFVWSGEGTNVEVWKGDPQIAPSEEAREMLLAA